MTQLLQASGLTFAYGDAPVLRGVDVTLSAGEVVALLGPNGSGKSTLIRTLLGHLRADAGSIAWDGRPIERWRRRELAKRVAYLPQAPTYEPQQTVGDVLRLGRAAYWTAFGIESPRDAVVVSDVARTLGLANLLDRLVDSLSGGQRQRVFVGRCLVQEPAALLLDEPSTFLDLRHQVELCELLRTLARENQLAVFMASHDLNLAAAYSDRVMLLHEGTIVAAGKAEVVMEEALLAKVYGVGIERIARAGGGVVVVPKSGAWPAAREPA